MEFVNALGSMIVMCLLLFVMFYGIRHRGRLVKWLENSDHDGNAREKESRIISLRRKHEDITRELKCLEETETGE